MTAMATTSSALMPVYRRWPVEFVEGQGCTLIASDGSEYLDLVAGIAVASIGHAHPTVARAVSEQMGRLVHVSNLYETRPQIDLANRLSLLTDGKLSFFCNSGAESIECALKLARKWGRTTKGPECVEIVSAEGSFHGRTFGALAVTGQPAKQAPFGPMLPGVHHVPYGDVASLERTIDERVCAVLLEPVQGEAGVVVPPPGYLTAVADLCREREVLFMLDEIQTGIARTGEWFAYRHYGIDPDVLCLAKALARELPIEACLASPEVAVLEPGDHASTFAGGPVIASAALATLDVIEAEDLVARARTSGARLMPALAAIVPASAEVRGLGLLIGIELAQPKAREVASRALQKGVLVNDATSSVVRLSPPLTLSDAEIDKAIAVLEEVFDEIEPA